MYYNKEHYRRKKIRHHECECQEELIRVQSTEKYKCGVNYAMDYRITYNYFPVSSNCIRISASDQQCINSLALEQLVDNFKPVRPGTKFPPPTF